MALVGLSFSGQLYEKSIILRHKNIDEAGVSDTAKLFCLFSPLSAVTCLSLAAESVTSNNPTAQSATHPPPRSITEQAGNR